jgi:hypothetical protein
MIHPRHIFADPQEFIRRCATDCRLGRYAQSDDYLEFLIQQTQRRDRKLLSYLARIGRGYGETRYYADADHIVPQSVWHLLMPRELCGPDRPRGAYRHSLSNLIWRGQVENRRDDEQAICMVFDEAHVRRSPSERRTWANEWIRRFLMTKRDEALACPADLVDISSLEDMSANGDGTNWLHRNASGHED